MGFTVGGVQTESDSVCNLRRVVSHVVEEVDSLEQVAPKTKSELERIETDLIHEVFAVDTVVHVAVHSPTLVDIVEQVSGIPDTGIQRLPTDLVRVSKNNKKQKMRKKQIKKRIKKRIKKKIKKQKAPRRSSELQSQGTIAM